MDESRQADVFYGFLSPAFKLDLGGVTARLLWLSTGHTKGDELVCAEPNSTLRACFAKRSRELGWNLQWMPRQMPETIRPC
jgi:hypothetical protein